MTNKEIFFMLDLLVFTWNIDSMKFFFLFNGNILDIIVNFKLIEYLLLQSWNDFLLLLLLLS